MNSSVNLKKVSSPFDFNAFNSNNSNNHYHHQNTCNSVQVKCNIKNFKSVIKKEHLKKLNQYKESLDKKIELLKEKLLESNNSNISQGTIKISLSNPLMNYENFRNFLILNGRNCLLFISFLNSNDLYRLLNVNKLIHKQIINNIINEVKKSIIPKYLLKYGNDFLFSRSLFFIELKKFKKNKKMNVRIILSIKSEVSSKNRSILKKAFQISFTTSINKTERTVTSYTFEIIPNNQPKLFWIFRECTDFHFDELDKAYYNNIVQFSPGDLVNITISVFSELGLLNISKFSWVQARRYLSNDRDCEVESLKNIWNDLSLLDGWKSISQSIHEIFGEYFIINKIFFDDVGYFIFKIYLTANKIGKIESSQNDYIGMTIYIKKKGEIIENEVKKNCLIFDEKNELNVTQGDNIIFYISKSK